MKASLFLLPAGLIAALAFNLSAQEGTAPPPPGPGGPGSGPGGPPPGGEGRPMRPMAMPVIVALDLDKNGEISAEEIAKAAESLKTLDKNGDGKLTPDELRPPRPAGPPQGAAPEGQPGRPGPGQGQGGGPRRQRPAGPPPSPQQ